MIQPTAFWYDWGGLNHEIFLAINHMTWPGSDALALAGTFVGDHHWYPVYIALAYTIATIRPGWINPTRVGVLLWGYLLSWWLIATLKPLMDFPRPLSVLGESAVHVLGKPEFFHSFPSGHTAFAFLLFVSLAPGSARPIQVLLSVFALWVLWSRLAVGAHFPVDVLGGAMVGVISAVFVSKIWFIIQGNFVENKSR